MHEINEFHIGAIKEVGNIGIGNAVTSLSQMLNKPVNITLPDLQFVEFETVPEQLGGAEKMVAGIVLQLMGDAEGFITLLLSEKSAKKIIEITMGTATEGEFTEMEQSLLNELGNIMAGNYVRSLADFLSLEFSITPPEHKFDMMGAILDEILAYMSMKVDTAIVLKTTYMIAEEQIDGNLVIFFNTDSLEKILRRVEQMAGVEDATGKLVAG